ncbi:exported hypothetical protein [Agrobacterium deltaense NCPPB 1641]|uniref:Uncharacterized protein n=1 Tax=Agrobacterium deltaense NCPPB 1641 TaxID=1183425 RepID=A0A1S7TSI9_9HYPH|nr:exported hypothetical protein [Agrobacterium deltaense NCPPB 1641]
MNAPASTAKALFVSVFASAKNALEPLLSTNQQTALIIQSGSFTPGHPALHRLFANPKKSQQTEIAHIFSGSVSKILSKSRHTSSQLRIFAVEILFSNSWRR